MAKIKKMSKEDIEAINKVALEKIETMEVTNGRKSEKQEFLLEIKEVINKAINKGIHFTDISKMIKELYSIDISVNMVKTFAINHLDYTTKKRGKKANTNTTKSEDKEVESDRIKASLDKL